MGKAPPAQCARHVIVTGGSSGIGAAIADAYAQRGANVSLLARTAAALDRKKRELEARFGQNGQRFHRETADVRDAGATARALGRCEGACGPCTILVTSAGIVEPAAFDAQDADRFDAQIATNLIGTANAVRAVFGRMKERRSGQILLIGSGAGLTGLFGYSAYCASKAGLIGFAEALRQEGRPYGITVSICLPPDTETPQLAAERRLRPPEAEAIIGTVRPWSAEAVAEAAVRGLERKREAIHPGLAIKALAHSGPFAPLLRRWFDRKIARAMRPTPGL